MCHGGLAKRGGGVLQCARRLTKMPTDLKRVRTEVFHVRIEPSLKQKTEAEAKRNRISPSTYVRAILSATLGYDRDLLRELAIVAKNTDETVVHIMDQIGERRAQIDQLKRELLAMDQLYRELAATRTAVERRLGEAKSLREMS